ncbi:MAG: ribonuclease H-like YkuK family protein, partial [Patescibacteria group bacterium]
MYSLDIEKIKFESITHGQLRVDLVIGIIKEFLEEFPNAEYSLVIGTDSHEITGSTFKNRDISLVTAILVHRRGFGGRYFWNKQRANNIHSLREKIYAE